MATSNGSRTSLATISTVVWPRRMAYTDLVEHVGVGERQVGDRELAQEQPLEHRLVPGGAGGGGGGGRRARH